MKEMELLSYPAFQRGILEIAKRTKQFNYKNIYGIPRAGLVVATYLSYLVDKPMVIYEKDIKPHTLIVDDIVDSGITMSQMHTAYPKSKTAALYYCEESMIEPDVWVYVKKEDFIQFPWETEETARVDYLGKNDG